MIPMPRVRFSKISFPMRRSSISSQKRRTFFMVALHSSTQPLGRSSFTPPRRAVGGGVLRADVERHPLGLELDVDPGLGGLPADVAALLALADGGHSAASSPSPSPSASSPSSGSPGIGSTSTRPGHGLTMR